MRCKPPEKLTVQIQRYIQEKTQQAYTNFEDIKKYAELISDELANKVESKVEEIPKEFIDPITGARMENPWRDKYGNTLDKSTWDLLSSNPYTREESEIHANDELKKKIEKFKKAHQG